VILPDAADAVLPTFPESLRRRAHRDLRRLGVETQVCGCRLFGIERRHIRPEREYSHFRLGMKESIPPSGDEVSRRTPNLERLDTGA
jgi:hypothetical protein